MSDEERLARLTELARKVWPHLYDPRVNHEMSGGAMFAYLSSILPATFGSTEGERVLYYHTRIGKHPRALDALEAALLVLSGERPGSVYDSALLKQRNQFHERLVDAEAKLAKVRATADAWQQRADQLSRARVHSAAIPAVDGCVRQIRTILDEP